MSKLLWHVKNEILQKEANSFEICSKKDNTTIMRKINLLQICIIVLGLWMAVSSVVAMDNSLKLWLNFDDVNEKSFTDKTGSAQCSARNLSIVNGTLSSSSPATDLIVHDNENFNFKNELTVSAWIYMNSQSSYRAIIFKGNRTVKPEKIQFYLSATDGHLQFLSKPSGYWQGVLWNEKKKQYDIPGAKTEKLPLQKWVQVAATFNKGRIKLYIDGKCIADTRIKAKELVPNKAPITIGAAQSSGTDRPNYTFDGRIDDIRIYSKALDDNAIKAQFDLDKKDYESRKIGVVKLSADTNSPKHSLFVVGDEVKLLFKAKGLEPSQKDLKLLVDIHDVYGKSIHKAKLPVKANGKGAWHGEMTVPSDRLGYYRAYIKLSNGVVLPSLGSRAGGHITYGITFDPFSRKLFPDDETFFGMQGFPGDGVGAAPYLGVRRCLGPSRWSWQEPDYPGQFREKSERLEKEGTLALPYPYLKTRHADIDGKGIAWQVYPWFSIMGVSFPEKWHASVVKEMPKNVVSHTKTGVLNAKGEAYFQDYCRAFAHEVARSFPHLKERYYGVLWEPELHMDPNDNMEQAIVRYMELAYPVIHEADPKAVVMGVCLADLRPRTLLLAEKLFSEGLGNYIDVFSIHPYFKRPPEVNGFINHVKELKKIIRKGSGRDIPIVGTEMGIDCSGQQPEDERLAAVSQARQDLIALGEGFKFNTAFYFCDHVATPQNNYGFFFNLDPKHNIYRPRKISPKMQALLYAAMSYLLEGHKSAGSIDWLGGTTIGYAYENADDVTLAIWDFRKESRAVSIPVGKDKVKVYDCQGNLSEMLTKDGMLTIEASGYPVYIQGVERSLWSSKAFKALKLQGKDDVCIFPGSGEKILLEVRAPKDKPIAGVIECDSGKMLEVEPSNIPVNVPAGTVKTLTFKVKPTPVTPIGTYTVPFILKSNGKILAGTGAVVKLKEPIAAGKAKPHVIHGKRSILLEVAEKQGRNTSGKVTFRVKDNGTVTGSTAFTLAPNATKIIELKGNFHALDSKTKYPLQLDFTFDSGGTYRIDREISFLSARRISNAFTVHGDLKKWKDVPAVHLDKESCNRLPNFYSEDTADLRFVWNDRALYMLAVVRDNVFMQKNTGPLTWKGDCLQCGFCIDPWKDVPRTGNTVSDEANSPRQTEINLALTQNGPEAWRSVVFPVNSNLPIGMLSRADCSLVIKRKDGTITYEAAFPWKSLGLKQAPQPGSCIKIAIAVNDKDDQKAISAIGLFKGAGFPRDPALMGTLFLEK